MTEDSVLLAESWRSDFLENVHRGTAVLVDDAGAVIRAWGNPDRIMYPRSANKPMQATGMRRCGLNIDGELLAIATASHSGGAEHLSAVRALLEMATLNEQALQTPPDYPLGEAERHSWIRAGRGPERIAMNCSGKHAAMLLTCRKSGWSVDDYLDVRHPLQQRLAASVSDLAGEPIRHIGIDGCGAPLFALSAVGMARALQAAMRDPDGAGVIAAMRAYPQIVGGQGRDVTRLMQQVPGFVAKDGADGVWVAALDDGRALAVKIDDGNPVARIVVVLGLLDVLGVPVAMDEGLVLGGGKPVGRMRAVL